MVWGVSTSDSRNSGRADVSQLLSLGAAAIARAAFFAAAGPAAAKDYEYRRGDLTSFMLQGGFET
jgi:hypothetical protein